jgi:hypothetical protein
MRIADLQQFIRALIPPLQASGAGQKVIGELEGASHHLEPFSGLTIEAFTAFLGRAEQYEKTGIIPVVAKAPPKSGVKKASKPTLSVEDALSQILSLYERSLGDDVTFPMIEAEVKQLNDLSKGDLDLVAAQFGLGKVKRTKPVALEAIREKIANYKKSHQRTQF